MIIGLRKAKHLFDLLACTCDCILTLTLCKFKSIFLLIPTQPTQASEIPIHQPSFRFLFLNMYIGKKYISKSSKAPFGIETPKSIRTKKFDIELENCNYAQNNLVGVLMISSPSPNLIGIDRLLIRHFECRKKPFSHCSWRSLK